VGFRSPPLSGRIGSKQQQQWLRAPGSGVAPPLGVVKEEEAVLIELVRWYRRAVGAALRRAVDDEVPGAVEEEAGPATVRRVPPGLLIGCAACTCPWCAWHRRCSTRRGSAPDRVR